MRIATQSTITACHRKKSLKISHRLPATVSVPTYSDT